MSRRFAIHELLHGNEPLLVRASPSPGDQPTLIAQNIRWAQSLVGGEPRGLVAGSVEPLRHRTRGLPNTYDTVSPAGIVGAGPPRDDGKWRVHDLHVDVAEHDVAALVRREAQQRGCAGWVPTTVLGHAGPTGPGTPTDTRLCTRCHMHLSANRFDGDTDVCRDCAG